MLNWSVRQVRNDPMHILWHLACGEMPLCASDENDEVLWTTTSHRGVQFLDDIQFPRKEKRYILSDRFDIRYDTVFDRVLDACASPRNTGRPWICDELREGYQKLHRLGFAHSYEAWQNGELAGGCIGIQIGAYVTCETMFHSVPNASKAAYGQTLLRLRDRGFKWVDVGEVADHRVNYGEVWVRQWKFEEMVRSAIRENCSLADDIPCPALPRSIALTLPVARLARNVYKRIPLGATSGKLVQVAAASELLCLPVV